MRRPWIACLAALLPWAAPADPAADGRALARLEVALRGLGSFRADFRQTVTDAQGEQVEAADGRVILARPGRFRWDYREPAQQIVSDGTTVWLYDADLEQVTVRPAAETLVGTPAQLLSGEADLRAQFEVADGGESAGLDWIELKPRDDEGDFQSLAVGLDGLAIREMTLVDRLGQRTRLEFDSVERNPRLDPALFDFQPPPGVDVVGRVPPSPP